jgi:hypothetical protein
MLFSGTKAVASVHAHGCFSCYLSVSDLLKIFNCMIVCLAFIFLYKYKSAVLEFRTSHGRLGTE